MKNTKQQLILEQVDKKLQAFQSLTENTIPTKGWVNTVRTALKMSLRQLGNRVNFSAQHIKQLESREANGTISINSLKEVANAMDMQLVYGFVPNQGSLDALIEKRAKDLATLIVLRTANTMKLEDQANSKKRIEAAIKERATAIQNEMPKILWD